MPSARTGEHLMKLTLAMMGMMIACLNLEPQATAQQGYGYPGAVGGVVVRPAGSYEMMPSGAVHPTTWAPGSYVAAGSLAPPQQILLPYSYYAVAPAPARV